LFNTTVLKQFLCHGQAAQMIQPVIGVFNQISAFSSVKKTHFLMKTREMADIGFCSSLNLDELEKSQFFRISVIPAKAGIQ
jgi:hypothetical protein